MRVPTLVAKPLLLPSLQRILCDFHKRDYVFHTGFVVGRVMNLLSSFVLQVYSNYRITEGSVRNDIERVYKRIQDDISLSGSLDGGQIFFADSTEDGPNLYIALMELDLVRRDHESGGRQFCRLRAIMNERFLAGIYADMTLDGSIAYEFKTGALRPVRFSGTKSPWSSHWPTRTVFAAGSLYGRSTQRDFEHYLMEVPLEPQDVAELVPTLEPGYVAGVCESCQNMDTTYRAHRCRHILCEECLVDSWTLFGNEKPECPVCSQQLDPIDPHALLNYQEDTKTWMWATLPYYLGNNDDSNGYSGHQYRWEQDEVDFWVEFERDESFFDLLWWSAELTF